MPPPFRPDSADASATYTVHTETIVASEADIDELGHVSNLIYLRWVQDIARRASAAKGLDWPAYQAMGAAFVVRRHEIEYHRPVRAGDAVQLDTWVSRWGAATSWRETRMIRPQSGELCCSTTTRWAYIDLRSGRPQRIPPEVLAALR